MSFQIDDKCLLTGLKKRPELNGRLVQLNKWNKKHERWEVCVFDQDGKVAIEDIRVKVGNLRKQPCPHKLEPIVAGVLDQFVRGGGLGFDSHMKEVGLGKGQLTNMMFISAANLAGEVYGTNDALILAMFLEHIGKDVDSELVQVKLREKIDAFFRDMAVYGVLVAPRWADMITSEELGTSMFNLRRGTLAFIEKHQSMLTMFAPKLKGRKFRHVVGSILGVMFGGGDSKSHTFEGLVKEINDASMGGRVTIIGPSGRKHIDVNPGFNQIYLRWLMEDVVQTLDGNDAKKGSLSKWHKLSQWEIELTARIQVSRHRISLDVSEEFEPYVWIEGLLSTDLNELSDVPGVDMDRRILRIAFFSDIAWHFATHSRDGDTSDGTSITVNRESQSKLKKGKRVIVHSLDNAEEYYGITDGMQGKIVEQKDEDHYNVSFTNLAEPQVLHKSHLQKAGKVIPREHILCKCGKESNFVCNRCGKMWYCSKECQLEDKDNHKSACDIHTHGFMQTLTKSFDRLYAEEGSHETDEDENDCEDDL